MARTLIDQHVITKLRTSCAGETDHVTPMAVVAGELFHAVKGFNWFGFYRVMAPGVFKLGPYQGGHGCWMIPFDKGVCGAATRKRQTQIVNDVHQFDGHMACAASTQSQRVIPVFDKWQSLVAVLDIDSSQPEFFSLTLAAQLKISSAKVFSRYEQMQ